MVVAKSSLARMPRTTKQRGQRLPLRQYASETSDGRAASRTPPHMPDAGVRARSHSTKNPERSGRLPPALAGVDEFWPLEKL
jgi:hypothetical protein